MSAKSEALDAISKLPEEASMDEIMYRLHVLDKVKKGEEGHPGWAGREC